MFFLITSWHICLRYLSESSRNLMNLLNYNLKVKCTYGTEIILIKSQKTGTQTDTPCHHGDLWPHASSINGMAPVLA